MSMHFSSTRDAEGWRPLRRARPIMTSQLYCSKTHCSPARTAPFALERPLVSRRRHPMSLELHPSMPVPMIWPVVNCFEVENGWLYLSLTLHLHRIRWRAVPSLPVPSSRPGFVEHPGRTAAWLRDMAEWRIWGVGRAGRGAGPTRRVSSCAWRRTVPPLSRTPSGMGSRPCWPGTVEEKDWPCLLGGLLDFKLYALIRRSELLTVTEEVLIIWVVGPLTQYRFIDIQKRIFKGPHRLLLVPSGLVIVRHGGRR